MKVAPLLGDLRSRREAGVQALLVHTGQHYDAALSDSAIRDLNMPKPDEFLGVGSGSHGRQTARVMERFEEVCERQHPDAVVVVGDVNSTLACALVAAKMQIPVAHVEAGLRSYDREMPEEINRVLTDQISNLLLTPSEDAEENLLKEGIRKDGIRFVGNLMIDSLRTALDRIGEERAPLAQRAAAGRVPYIVVTLHRPGNVDNLEDLRPILNGLDRAAREAAILFPVHPRTSARLLEAGRSPANRLAADGSALRPGMYLVPPMPYLEFVSLLRHAALVLTDSGGIQEETTVMGVPCATLRPSTERPVTILVGTNELVARNPDAIEGAVHIALSGSWKKGAIPKLWDGHAAGRAVDELLAGSWLTRTGSCRHPSNAWSGCGARNDGDS